MCSLTRVTISRPNPHSHTYATVNSMPLPNIMCQMFFIDGARLPSYPFFTHNDTEVFDSGADPHRKGRGMDGKKTTQTGHIDNECASNGAASPVSWRASNGGAIPVNGRAGNGAAVSPLN